MKAAYRVRLGFSDPRARATHTVGPAGPWRESSRGRACSRRPDSTSLPYMTRSWWRGFWSYSSSSRIKAVECLRTAVTAQFKRNISACCLRVRAALSGRASCLDSAPHSAARPSSRWGAAVPGLGGLRQEARRAEAIGRVLAAGRSATALRQVKYRGWFVHRSDAAVAYVVFNSDSPSQRPRRLPWVGLARHAGARARDRSSGRGIHG